MCHLLSRTIDLEKDKKAQNILHSCGTKWVCSQNGWLCHCKGIFRKHWHRVELFAACLPRLGFMRCVQACLQLVPNGLLHCGPPCSSFVWVSRGSTRRSKQNVLGSKSAPSVQEANQNLGFTAVSFSPHMYIILYHKNIGQEKLGICRSSHHSADLFWGPSAWTKDYCTHAPLRHFGDLQGGMCSDRTTAVKSDAFFPSPFEDGGAA